MIATHNGDRYSSTPDLREQGQCWEAAPGNDVVVFEPEVEQVAVDEQVSAQIRNRLQKPVERIACTIRCVAEMGVRYDDCY